MTDTHLSKRDAWGTIAIFLVIMAGLSGVAHFAIVKLNPASIYVGALMCCPAVAAFATLLIKGRKLTSLPWGWGAWRDNLTAYAVPVGYVSLAYLAIWGLGFGGVPDPDRVSDWARQLGLSPDATVLPLVFMIFLLGTVQFVKSLGSIAGEEIGWRGFFIWELRKVTSFEGVAIFSGIVWAVWHYPIILAYGGGDPVFQIACFTLMIISMSVILAYFTFKSHSLWPAVFFHTAHNIYIQKIFTPLTVDNDQTSFWVDEYGLMVPLVVTLFALYYWRKAKREGL